MLLDCIIGSAAGTLSSVIIGFYIMRYQIMKDVYAFEDNMAKLVEELSTIKIKLYNEK